MNDDQIGALLYAMAWLAALVLATVLTVAIS